MNGYYPTGRTPYDYGAASLSSQNSNPANKPQAYAQDGNPTEFAQVVPQYKAPDPNSTPRSARVDLKDPIQVHLLTETALSDSRGYEILSQEEVDELKKQAALLAQRVETTRSNLAIQSKYRDATASMARLNALSQNDEPHNREAERERIENERKCDELAAELLNLEKRLLIPHRKIVEHTAAILQLTHKASRKKNAPQNGQPLNGIPGSPESLYTYSHGRNSLDQAGDDTYFDDPSAYHLDGVDRPRKNAIEIPLKSPVREQNQLRVELDRMREENSYLRSQTDGLLKRLRRLNVSMRDTIVRFNPEINQGYDEPPQVSTTPDFKIADLLNAQLEYLESGLVAVQAEQDTFAGGIGMGERLEAMNLQLRDLLMTSDPHYTPTQLPLDSDVNGQMSYLEDSIRSVDSHVARANSPSKAHDDAGPMLANLWVSMQTGFAEAKERMDDRKRSQIEKGITEDDMSDDEDFDTVESYSLGSFVDRVQRIHAQAITLRDQKYVLKRQIRQQRELNKSDGEKDKELERKQRDLEEARQQFNVAEKSRKDAEEKLSTMMSDFEKAREAADRSEAVTLELEACKAQITQLEQGLEATQTSLAAAESGNQGSESKLATVNAQIEELTQGKIAAETAVQSLRVELSAKKQEISDTKRKVDDLESEMVDLKLDLTVAKAELDGAYGSRAERAADVAALREDGKMDKLKEEIKRLQGDIDELRRKDQELRKELQGMTDECQRITSESVGLTGELDDALRVKDKLKEELHNMQEKMAKLQEDLDNERLRTPSDGSRPGAGASVLSERFRATMREERKRFQDDLKEERLKYRKLEEELSKLKRNLGPGKSSLTPR
ncbi:involucrin repeat protein [Metarhizium album ARSEF 1941]|uniref:Involucrin repeat protein n=1 Tax=Metarhizium album (strain ARSEF 1941) TaxID=1081103 RepID=A0A0B2X6D1_METAS|nr:involucrin repeat protein [Metarhizium album ARSEF 1941]KHO01949.1 involucrin repeat protein [Metarhizium album ARSEF 1941]